MKFSAYADTTRFSLKLRPLESTHYTTERRKLNGSEEFASFQGKHKFAAMFRNFLSIAPFFKWHATQIEAPRTERLAVALASLAPPSKSMLDIGSSKGKLARAT